MSVLFEGGEAEGGAAGSCGGGVDVGGVGGEGQGVGGCVGEV